MEQIKTICFIKKHAWIVFAVFLVAFIIFLFGRDSTSATVTIFILSLLFFHLILIRFAKHEKIWKSTDYIFEIAAIISLIAAVSGLSEASKQKTLQDAFSNRKLAQVKLLYAVELTLTNDCYPKKTRMDIWTVTPEPIKGECDRIESFLPQMKFEFDQETGPENMTSENLWGFNLSYENVQLDGSWSMIHLRANEFLKVNENTEKAIKIRDASDGSSQLNISKIDKVVYWHHILVFLLALKIARISMDIFKK